MSDLLAFLNDRLDEDEATARAAASWPNHEADGWREALAAQANELGAAEVEHIARHGPDRVLRQVAAMRAILEYYVEPPNGYRSGSLEPMSATIGEVRKAPTVLTVIEAIVLDIAAVWSDHPDYDPAWRS
jgi:Family of unknown function (DUF6221)